MEIIRRYVKEINPSIKREESCELLVKQFMNNLSSIIDESEFRFIYRYFMSAILTFCADINFQNDELIESFIRIFVSEQDGIWDIWSIFIYEERQWNTIERCLKIKLNNVSDKSGSFVLKYILNYAHKLRIEFIDPNDSSHRIRFVDYPRFSSVQSNSELWRHLHLPVLNCTLLPENHNILRLLLQYGAKIPTIDYQIHHFVSRFSHSITISNPQRLIKNLIWIQLVVADIPFQSLFYNELSLKAQQISETLINSYSYPLNLCLAEPIPQIPSLKHLLRFYIRKRLRSNWGLPQNIESLEIPSILKDYINLNY
jgi:hypothetical protein